MEDRLVAALENVSASLDERIGAIENGSVPLLNERLGQLDELNLEVRIGAIESTSVPLLDQVGQIDDRLAKVEDKLKFSCPIQNNKYRLISSVCYYFESQKMNYADAQRNCKRIFGSILVVSGHLFEPFSNEECNRVYHQAKSVLGTGSTDYWLGLDSIGRGSNNFHYASTGTPKNPSLTSGDLDTGDYCATVGSSDGRVQDEPCSNKYYSICETKYFVT